MGPQVSPLVAVGRLGAMRYVVTELTGVDAEGLPDLVAHVLDLDGLVELVGGEDRADWLLLAGRLGRFDVVR